MDIVQCIVGHYRALAAGKIQHVLEFVTLGARVNGYKDGTENGGCDHQVDKLRVVFHHQAKNITFVHSPGLQPGGQALTVVPQLLKCTNLIDEISVGIDADKSQHVEIRLFADPVGNPVGQYREVTHDLILPCKYGNHGRRCIEANHAASIVGQADAGVFNLPGLASALQLFCQFNQLCGSAGANRMTFTQ